MSDNKVKTFACAHRGDSSRFRENTIIAIQSAIDAGASGITALGKSAKALGDAWKGTPLVGGIISTFGLALETAGEAGGKLLKFANA